MKRLMFAISLAGMMALGASAAVESSNTFGVLKVDSNQKQTIIAVPWIQVGDGTASIAVADLVMTSNLTVDDMLYFYNSNTGVYLAWTLVEIESVKSWQAVNNVTVSGTVTSGENAGTQTAPRGSALILVRANPTPPIYLYGQYASGTVGTTVTANAWNLIAPPTATDFVVSSEGTPGTACMSGAPASGDYIVLSSAPTKRYKYVDGKWYNSVKTLSGNETKTYLTIPAGTGAWYVSAGGTPTFTW